MNNRKKAISFLKEKALSAYHKGDIGTVRHLSAIALYRVTKDGRKGLDFQDLLWSFIFMIIYSKSQSELSSIVRRAYIAFGPDSDITLKPGYSPRPPNVETSSYAPLINFVLDILKLNWSKLTEHYEAATIFDVSDNYNNDISTDLLLTRVIELWWYVDNNSGRWRVLIAQWKSLLPPQSRKYKLIEQLEYRLEIQNTLLYAFEAEKIVKLLEIFPKDINENEFMMAQAWFYIFQEQWDQLDNLFIQMKKNISFESEYALSFLGLVNNTKSIRDIVRSSNTSPSKAYSYFESEPALSFQGLEKSKETIPSNNPSLTDDSPIVDGLLRSQRIKFTRPIALFYSQLEALFDENELDLNKKQQLLVSKRKNMLAVSILLELESLRIWDLDMYLSSINRKIKIHINLGTYYNESGTYQGFDASLKNALISAVRAANSKLNNSEELKRAENLLEVLPPAKDFINEIVEVVIKTPPFQYPSALVIIEILGDAVAEEYLEKLAEWSIAVFEQNQSNAIHYNSQCLNFWTKIFEHHKISKIVWDILAPAINKLFGNSYYWRTCENFLVVLLSKAPLAEAKNLASIMANTKNKDTSLEEDLFRILFNSSIKNKNLKNIVEKFLAGNIDSQSIDYEYERRILNNNYKLPIGESIIQLNLIEQLEKICTKIKSSSTVNPNIILDYSRPFIRVNWSDCKKNQLSYILQLISETVYESQNISNNEIYELLLILKYITFSTLSSSNEFANSVIKFIHKIIEQPPNGIDNSFNNGPLSNFNFTINVKKIIPYAIINIVSELYRVVDKAEQKYFQKWAINEICTTESLNLDSFSKLFLDMYFFGNRYVKEKAIYGLKIIYVRVNQGDELSIVLRSLYLSLDNIHNSNSNTFLTPNSHLALLECIRNFIEIAHSYPDPDVRMYCSLLVVTCDSLGWDVNLEEESRLSLKNDIRARVRNIFKK